jgi:hypothetical protein
VIEAALDLECMVLNAVSTVIVSQENPEWLRIKIAIADLEKITALSYAAHLATRAQRGANVAIGTDILGAITGAVQGAFSTTVDVNVVSAALSVPGSLAGGAAGSVATSMAVDAGMTAADAATREGTWGRWIARGAAKSVAILTGGTTAYKTAGAIDRLTGGEVVDIDDVCSFGKIDETPAEGETPVEGETPTDGETSVEGETSSEYVH